MRLNFEAGLGQVMRMLGALPEGPQKWERGCGGGQKRQAGRGSGQWWEEMKDVNMLRGQVCGRELTSVGNRKMARGSSATWKRGDNSETGRQPAVWLRD